MSRIDDNQIIIRESRISPVKVPVTETGISNLSKAIDVEEQKHDVDDVKKDILKHSDEVNKFDFQNPADPILKGENPSQLKLPGLEKAWIGSVKTNTNSSGKSETAILVPKGLDYSKDIKVIYFFHGHGGSISYSVNSFKDDVMKYAKENNAIIVIPQGPAEDNGKRKTDSWMKPPKGNFAEFNKEVLGNIKNILPPSQNGKSPKITSIELAGHSAGGVAVRNCLESISEGKNNFSGGDWNNISISNVHFLDASYEDGAGSRTSNRAEETYTAINKMDNKPKFHILVATNGDREYNFGTENKYHFKDKEELKKKGVDLENISRKGISHGEVPKVFFTVK